MGEDADNEKKDEKNQYEFLTSIPETIHNLIFYNNVVKGFDYKYKKILSIARLLLIAFICIVILTPLNAVDVIQGSGSSSVLTKTPNMMVLKQVFLYWVDIMIFFLLFLELADFHDIKIMTDRNIYLDESGPLNNFFPSMLQDVDNNSFSVTHFLLSLMGVIGYLLFHVNTFLVNYIN